MDLIKDLSDILVEEYKKLGIPIQNKDTHHLLTGFFNLSDKTISPKRRTIRISKELNEKNLEEPYNEYLKQIRHKFKYGKNVNTYLSKKAFKPAQKDPLLYDWGIHHLHLNNEFSPEGFVERSDYLLFCIIKSDTVYFIDVTKHKLDDRTEFSQQKLLRIVKSNWSHLLEPFKMKGFSSLERKMTDKDYAELRHAGAMSFVEIDGEVFAMIGGGISTARTNIKHTIKADNVFRSLRDMEEHLHQIQKDLLEINLNTKLPQININYKLIQEGDSFFVIEEKSGNKVIESKSLYNVIFGLKDFINN
ncbi:hypothetical protein D0469_07105 [Peribacillus saganii]|uniref:Uncharacterized protein n=1 Tax=Peribacillus saganii TaxID=2303992 RepID=A0A372LRF6_9BACI|nr:hypothetical protein D0469_07105 [Peribacillus saganii]